MTHEWPRGLWPCSGPSGLHLGRQCCCAGPPPAAGGRLVSSHPPSRSTQEGWGRPSSPQFPRRRVKEATSPHKGGPGAGTALKGAHVGDGPVVATVRQNVAPAERKGAKKREVTWLVELGDPTFVATRQNAKGPGPDKPAGMRGLGDPTLTGTLGGHTGAKCPVRQEHCVCVIRLSWKNRK